MLFYKNYDYIVNIPDVFTSEEIDRIHNQAALIDKMPGDILVNGEYIQDPSIRDSGVSWFVTENPNNNWIVKRISDIIDYSNNNFFHFDISGIDNIQYSRYTAPSGLYGSHSDTSPQLPLCRKISCTVQLSDPLSYDGGDLKIYNARIENPFIAQKKLGHATVFASFMVHEVTPVTRGERTSLVSWVSGPPMK